MAGIEQISSSVDALMKEFDTLTHNVANVSTTGYKRRCNAFSQSLKSLSAGQANSPGQINVESALDFSQGGFVQTGRPMDFALYGNGFFVVETAQGPLYTRNGTFFTNQNGQIVDEQGRIVAGQSGAITIPNNLDLSQLSVSANGTLGLAGSVLGQFKIVDFRDNQGKLVPVGTNCYQMPEEFGTAVPAEKTVVKQGYVEASNVKVIEELVDMIMVTRLYEANMKLVSAQKDNSGSIISAAMG